MEGGLCVSVDVCCKVYYITDSHIPRVPKLHRHILSTRVVMKLYSLRPFKGLLLKDSVINCLSGFLNY